MIQVNDKVSDIVTKYPKLAPIFEGLEIDYCCGGAIPLKEACNRQGLNESAITALLNIEANSSNTRDTDVQHLSAKELITHIIDTHHRYLRTELPRIKGLMDRVFDAHSEQDSRIIQLMEKVNNLIEELLPHRDTEEIDVFPKILDFLAGKETNLTAGEIDALVDEHQRVGDLLNEIRKITDAYIPPYWACPTTVILYSSLRDLELDTHRHIHKENFILFPMVRGQLSKNPYGVN